MSEKEKDFGNVIDYSMTRAQKVIQIHPLAAIQIKIIINHYIETHTKQTKIDKNVYNI